MLFCNVRSWMMGVVILALAPASHANTRVELSVVTDWQTVSYYGSVDETKKFIDATVASANVIYGEELGLDLIVTYVEIPADAASDHVSIATHAQFLLDSLKTYRTEHPAHRAADVTVLFSIRDLSLGARKLGGYATVGTTCSASSSAIVSLKNNGLDHETLAHEVAHTLGAHHDGESPCESESATGWLMSPTAAGQEHFSQCSTDTIKREIALFGADCLDSTTPSPAPVASNPPASSAGSATSTTNSASNSSGGGGASDPFGLLALIALGGQRWFGGRRSRLAEHRHLPPFRGELTVASFLSGPRLTFRRSQPRETGPRDLNQTSPANRLIDTRMKWIDRP